jgi:hypothetical protein
LTTFYSNKSLSIAGPTLRRAGGGLCPLAALDDRPRPGKEPTITPEANAWLVSLACEKAKEHG